MAWELGQTLDPPDAAISDNCLAFSPDGNYLAVGGDSGAVTVYDTRSWEVAQTLNPSIKTPGTITGIAWDPSMDHIAYTETGDNYCWVHEVDVGGVWTFVDRLQQAEDDSGGPINVAITDISPGANQGWIAYGNWNGDVYVHLLSDGSHEATITEGSGVTRGLSWTPDGFRLAHTDDGSETTYVYFEDTWGVESELDGGVGGNDIIFTEDGRSRLAHSLGGSVEVRQVSENLGDNLLATLNQSQTDWVPVVRLSDDWVVYGDEDGFVFVHQLDGGYGLETTLQPDQSSVAGLGFNASYLAVAAEGGSVYIHVLPGVALASATAQSFTPEAAQAATSASTVATETAVATKPAVEFPASLGISPRSRTVQAETEAVGFGSLGSRASVETTSQAAAAGVAWAEEEALGFAEVPLLDGQAIGAVTEQVVSWDELRVRYHANLSEVEDKLREIKENTRRYAFVPEPEGGFRARGQAGGANTFRYSPSSFESGFMESVDVLADTYEEIPTSIDADDYDVAVTFRLAGNHEPEEGLIDEGPPDADDWVFRTHAGDVVTPRVEAEQSAEGSGGVPVYKVNLVLDQDQAAAVRRSIGHLGAVTDVAAEGGGTRVRDFSPGLSNQVGVTPRNDNLMPGGQYVVTGAEIERRDRTGTWYDVRLTVAETPELTVGSSGPESGFGARTATAETSVIRDRAVAHFDAQAITGASDGDTVTAWTDQAGNLTADQGPGAVYRQGAIGGNPALFFDGSSHYLYSNGSFTSTGPHTVLVVMSIEDDGDTRCIFNTADFGTFNPALNAEWLGPGLSNHGWNIDGVEGTENNDARLVSGVLKGAGSSVREDGIETNTGSSQDDPLGLVSIGARDGADEPSAFWDGHIGEILVFDEELEDWEIEAEESRLAEKWGVDLAPGA